MVTEQSISDKIPIDLANYLLIEKILIKKVLQEKKKITLLNYPLPESDILPNLIMHHFQHKTNTNINSCY